MKANPNSFSISLIMIMIVTAWITVPAFGGAILENHQVVLTEVSSSILLVSYDGVLQPVTFSSADNWLFSIPNVATLQDMRWFEEDPAFSNVVAPVHPGTAGEPDSVASDSPNAFPPQPNGFTYVGAGMDISDNRAVDFTFFDNGDVAGVPETGTTCALFGVSITCLALLRHKSYQRRSGPAAPL